jgi:uncharacterized protein
VKRRSAERTDWAPFTRRRFHSMYVDSPEFTGYRTLLLLDEVSKPFWTYLEAAPRCVADSGFAWLQHFPASSHHTVTTMFDRDGRIAQWYIDICEAHGIDERGVPWFDDLYLDIVVSPSGRYWLLDEDELDAALETEQVSRDTYDLAHAEARRLLDAIAAHTWPLLALSEAHLAAHRAVLADSADRAWVRPEN